MRRRALLRSLAGLPAAGLAGCLGSDGDAGRTPTGTTPGGDPATEPPATDPPASPTDPPATPTATPAGSVSVAVESLQPGVVALTTPDSIGVDGTGYQYLFLAVEASDPAPEPGAFAFRMEGEHDPVGPDEVPRDWWRIRRTDGTLYDAESRSGLVAFELPNAAGDGADPVLSWPGGEWRPDETLRERLTTFDPPMSVEFGVRETDGGDHPTLSVTATNAGDVPGRFLAGLNREGSSVAYRPVQRVSFTVPAGESETVDVTDETLDVGAGARVEAAGDGESSATYHLDWKRDRTSLSIRVVDEE
ncbi:hypothetical protein BRD00_04320 [Halobacteriales archaeon QS_8_69_26]|nr:MAG: hypothetical protein BRD00_04320 [Halobacteriales archaeon QS_8_69_26]